MLRLITGAIGVVMLAVFLGFYIVRVDAPPLWIIMVVCAVMALYDLVLEKPPNGKDDQ